VVSVLEPEDSSGWTKVRTNDGREGLVPGSYLQTSTTSSTGAPGTNSSAVRSGQQGLFRMFFRSDIDLS